jgi:DNA-binding MarR family transcriptional regulator
MANDTAGAEAGPLPFRLGDSFEREFPGAEARSTECIINVVATAQLIEALVDPRLRLRGLSMGSMNALEILRGAGEPLPPSVISERLLVTRATVTSLVDSLERRGLVRRGPHPADRRMLLVELTAEGGAALDEFMPWLHHTEKSWVAELDEVEKEQLIQVLGKVQQALDKQRTAMTETRREEAS